LKSYNIFIEFIEDVNVLITGIELCDSHNISIEKFAELWLTFRITNNKSINLTFNTLLEMEKAILKEQKLDDSTMKNIENQEDTRDNVPVKTWYSLIFLNIL
jgi:hypothetical protein